MMACSVMVRESRVTDPSLPPFVGDAMCWLLQVRWLAITMTFYIRAAPPAEDGVFRREWTGD